MHQPPHVEYVPQPVYHHPPPPPPVHYMDPYYHHAPMAMPEPYYEPMPPMYDYGPSPAYHHAYASPPRYVCLHSVAYLPVNVPWRCPLESVALTADDFSLSFCPPPLSLLIGATGAATVTTSQTSGTGETREWTQGEASWSGISLCNDTQAKAARQLSTTVSNVPF
jgi:hypothetical protein